MSCGFGCGSSQNGLLSLLRSVRKARTFGSICGSVEGSAGAMIEAPSLPLVGCAETGVDASPTAVHMSSVVFSIRILCSFDLPSPGYGSLAALQLLMSCFERRGAADR